MLWGFLFVCLFVFWGRFFVVVVACLFACLLDCWLVCFFVFLFPCFFICFFVSLFPWLVACLLRVFFLSFFVSFVAVAVLLLLFVCFLSGSWPIFLCKYSNNYRVFTCIHGNKQTKLLNEAMQAMHIALLRVAWLAWCSAGNEELMNDPATVIAHACILQIHRAPDKRKPVVALIVAV